MKINPPGLDGFNSKFYKDARSIVGPDVITTIQEFFQSEKLLRSWNIAAITLIPKVDYPFQPGDFRPIACCHTLYKYISTLICSRLRNVLGSIISQNQGAFAAGCNTPAPRTAGDYS